MIDSLSMTSHQDSLKKLEKIEEALTCIICQGVMEDPHALFCGHAFCGFCILQWFSTKKICPTCKEPVRRQPIHVNSLQKLSDALRSEGTVPTTRLTREDWKPLFPVGHQAAYIRDEDQDGVILRCSECGWELDEDNYCTGCSAYYGEPGLRLDGPPSETESRYDNEEEEELSSGFVVSDNEPMEYSDGHSLPDDSSDDEVTEVVHQCQTIEIDDSSDGEQVQTIRKNRKRRIDLVSDDEEVSDDSDDKSENDRPNVSYDNERAYTRDMHYISEEEDYEEDEDYPEDPFSRSKFVDDYADEDDNIKEPVKSKQPQQDPLVQVISKAKDKMVANLPSSSATDVQAHTTINSDSNSSDGESDAPDYGGISGLLLQDPSHNKPMVILGEDSSSVPLSVPSTSKPVNGSSSKSKKAKKHKSKKDKKRQKKNK